MSAPLAHYPHSSDRTNTVPECTCFAILLDRKFIASRGPPPLLDAERIVRSISFSNESQQKFRISVYRDRLVVLHGRHRNEKLADIFFDDIMQLERLNGDILFILCGRRGMGVYYFFKLSDVSKIDRIMQLALKINPNFRFFETNDMSSVQNFPRSSMHKEHPENDGTSGYDSYQFKRDNTTSRLAYSGSNAGNFPCNDSFVEWKGPSTHPPRSRSNPNKQLPIQSRSHNPGRKNQKTAESTTRAKSSNNKRKARMPLENDPRTLKPFRRPKFAGSHKGGNMTHPYSVATGRHTHKMSHQPKPRTFILKTNIKSDHGRNAAKQRLHDPLDISDSSEFINSLPIDRYQTSNGSRYRNTMHQNRDMGMHNLNMGFNVPGNGDFSSDTISSTTEDSLYLERELQNELLLSRSSSNHLPELKDKFRQLNLK